MSQILLVSLMVLAVFIAALALAEWAASHWIDLRRQREQALDDEISDAQRHGE